MKREGGREGSMKREGEGGREGSMKREGEGGREGGREGSKNKTQ